MQYEIIKDKTKKAISALYRADYFYGSKQYGESVYCCGGIELTVTRERTFNKDVSIYTLTSPDFIVEYSTGSYDAYNGEWGQTIWKAYENLETAGDLQALDRALIWLSLAS